MNLPARSWTRSKAWSDWKSGSFPAHASRKYASRAGGESIRKACSKIVSSRLDGWLMSGNTILRHGRGRSAELHSAVSQICNLQRSRQFERGEGVQRAAECNSAIRQIENLRYVENRFFA